MLENGHEMVVFMDDDVDRTNGSDEDWPGLVREFEMRAVERGNYVPVSQRTYRETEIDLAPGDKDNIEQFKFLKHTESAQMTAMTVSFWWLGKVLRLDGWFQLLYPFPAVFAAMRWGPRNGLLVVLATLFWVNFTLGPFSALSYVTSQGLSTLILCRGFWDRWPSILIIIPCVFAKMVGFGVIIAIISFCYHADDLSILVKQAETLLQGLGTTLLGSTWMGPTEAQIRLVIILSFMIHSIVYSICAHLTTSMLLYRVSKFLKRKPRLIPLLQWLFKRASDRYREKYGYAVEDTW